MEEHTYIRLTGHKQNVRKTELPVFSPNMEVSSFHTRHRILGFMSERPSTPVSSHDSWLGGECANLQMRNET